MAHADLNFAVRPEAFGNDGIVDLQQTAEERLKQQCKEAVDLIREYAGPEVKGRHPT